VKAFHGSEGIPKIDDIFDASCRSLELVTRCLYFGTAGYIANNLEIATSNESSKMVPL
jgi:hypothetical protein